MKKWLHALFLLRPTFPGLPDFREGLDGQKIPARLLIDYSFSATGFNFKLTGDFPRRVKEGEVLASDENRQNFPLLSPLAGLVRKENEDILSLRMEGSLKFGSPSRENRILHNNDEEFFIWMKSMGLVSLDFPGTALFELFQKAKNNPSPLLVLSYKDRSGIIDWRKFFKEKGIKITQAASDIARAAGMDYILESGSRKGHPETYGLNQPEIKTALISGRYIQSNRALHDQGIVYIAAQTLFSLCEAMYAGRPFTSRHIPVLFQSGKKRVEIRRIQNGLPMDDLIGQVDTDCEILPGLPLEKDSRYYYRNAAGKQSVSIFGVSVFTVRERSEAIARPCVQCMECDSVCPVSAAPFQLLDQGKGFRNDLCLKCGLCQYVCKSNIPFMKMIDSASNYGPSAEERSK